MHPASEMPDEPEEFPKQTCICNENRLCCFPATRWPRIFPGTATALQTCEPPMRAGFEPGLLLHGRDSRSASSSTAETSGLRLYRSPAPREIEGRADTSQG